MAFSSLFFALFRRIWSQSECRGTGLLPTRTTISIPIQHLPQPHSPDCFLPHARQSTWQTPRAQRRTRSGLFRAIAASRSKPAALRPCSPDVALSACAFFRIHANRRTPSHPLQQPHAQTPVAIPRRLLRPRFPTRLQSKSRFHAPRVASDAFPSLRRVPLSRFFLRGVSPQVPHAQPRAFPS